MKLSKPLTTAALVAGLVVGGAGVAAAGDDAGTRNSDTDVEETTFSGQQVQLEDDTEAEEDGERNRRRARRSNRRSARSANVADAIGIETEDLRAELQDGASIADVAEANEVAVDDVIDALVANIEERLAAKVEEGRLTADEAAEKLESKTERIANKVNGVRNEAQAETTSA